MYDHQRDDQQISIDWQSNLWHYSIWNIYLIHFVNLQCGSEKNAAQSTRAVIISHKTLCQATILHLSYYILLNPCKIFSNLTNLIPNFCIPTTEQIVFGCTRKTTILTELLPPSYLFDTHPASFLLVHQLVNCWKLLQTPHLRHFWTLNHHSAYLSLLLPPITSSQESTLLQDESRLADVIHLSFKTRRHCISICWEYNPSI